MARKSKIRFEWDEKRDGLLWAIRDHGDLTMTEVLEGLRQIGMAGSLFTIVFFVHEESGFTGWEAYDERDGESWQLWQVIDGDPCPICGKLTPPQYCGHCGNQIVFPGEVFK